MAISGDYPSPVTVNGFSCKNCTEVDEAKKFIDPAHPKDGPFGVNAKDHKTGAAKDAAHPGDPSKPGDRAGAVVFGGQLAALAGAANGNAPPTFSAATAPGARLDISA